MGKLFSSGPQPWSETPWLERSKFFDYLFMRFLEFNDAKVNGVCVDIGCGDDRSIGNALFLLKYFSEVVCTDLNKQGLKNHQEKSKKLRKQTAYVVADAQHLPFKNESVDGVSAFSLIEHLPKQIEFIGEVRRILVDDSLFILQFPNRQFPLEVHTGVPFPSIIPIKVQKRWGQFMYGWIDFELNSLTKKAAIKLCEMSFKSISIQNVNFTENLIPIKFRVIKKVLEKSGFLKFVPMGYFFICTT